MLEEEGTRSDHRWRNDEKYRRGVADFCLALRTKKKGGNQKVKYVHSKESGLGIPHQAE